MLYHLTPLYRFIASAVYDSNLLNLFEIDINNRHDMPTTLSALELLYEVHINWSGKSSLRDTDRAMTPPSENILALNNLYHEEAEKCQVSDDAEVKKKTQRNIGWGLRQFSMLVCKKVEAKGRTTYNEVADEIIAELAPLQTSANSFVFEEKNIRRRVYDAFNVLMAIDAIVKDKKEIRWVGWSCTKTAELKGLKEVRMNLMNSIQKKARFLKDLEDQFVDHQNLMLRNQRLHKSANMSSQGVALPFLLVRTNPKATVEIEISEDQHFVKFDFNGTPFTVHDAAAILKEMRCSQALETDNATRSSLDGSNLITDPSGK